MLHIANLNETGTLPTQSSRSTMLCRVIQTVYVWQRRVIERAKLAELDQRALEDVGLSREHIAEEIAKPVWTGLGPICLNRSSGVPAAARFWVPSEFRGRYTGSNLARDLMRLW